MTEKRRTKKRIDKIPPTKTKTNTQYIVVHSFGPIANCSHFRITLELESEMCLPVRAYACNTNIDTRQTNGGRERHFLCKSASIKICRFHAKKLCLQAFAHSLCVQYIITKHARTHALTHQCTPDTRINKSVLILLLFSV